MLPSSVMHSWLFVVKILLFNGMFLKNSKCDSTDEFHEHKVCCTFWSNSFSTGCCQTENSICNTINTTFTTDNYSVTLNEIHSRQDIVLMRVPPDKVECMPSKFYRTKGAKSFNLSQDGQCGRITFYNESACTGSPQTDYNITFHPNNVSCVNTFSSTEQTTGISTTTATTAGSNKEITFNLTSQNPPVINIGFTSSGVPSIIQNENATTGFSYLVHIPSEASAMAVEKNSSIARIGVFTGMVLDDPSSFILDNVAVEIDMGVEIHNLSHTVDIQFTKVNKKGNTANCISWNGTGDKPTWITDGCKTVEDNGSIICQCTHLTFFALLMSPPSTNISSSDYKSLTYITSIGCGLSMFFLAVAIFMHFLIRKGKASQATKILINLLIAMFVLNLSFLVNKSIADLGIFSACVAAAAVMHYAMLATLSWFFVVALHVFLNLRNLSAKIKHYMMKIYIAGWATPAVVVIALLAVNKYDFMSIYIDNGSTEKMCWIPDPIIHQAVNIGYYAIVFIFSFGILILTIPQIVTFTPATGKAQRNKSIKKNCFSILSLLFLLGITWAFAFFSFGPLLLASYYIFSILNSFQGFFLFIYYYNSRKIVGEDKSFILHHSSTSVKSDE